MKYFSMFTGIGGFELGIDGAWLDHEPEASFPICVGYSEIDPFAIKTFEEHFKYDNFGDATTINAKDIPPFDLLVGGFPCQAFSMAGNRRGFDDTRGTLFFDVARILKNKRPRHLVLENVKGLLSHDGGKTFTTIVGVLTDLGYDIEWQLLNSKNFGTPQNRERIYIIGHLRAECTRKVLPIGRSNKSGIKEITQNAPQSQRLYEPSGISPTLDVGEGGNRQVKIVAQRSRKYIGREAMFEERKDNLTNTLTSVEKDNYLAIGDDYRRLTPVEYERLQGFPDNWTFGTDRQRYKQCGNAVTVNTVQNVMSALLRSGCII